MGPSTHRHRSDATTTADSKAKNNLTPAMKNFVNILKSKEGGGEKEEKKGKERGGEKEEKKGKERGGEKEEKKETKRKVKVIIGWSESFSEEHVKLIVSRHLMNSFDDVMY
jgi:hypothetical protein